MKFNITATIVHHHYNHSDEETKSLLKTIIKNQKQMALTQEQLANELKVIKEQNDKARAEVLAKIAALEQQSQPLETPRKLLTSHWPN